MTDWQRRLGAIKAAVQAYRKRWRVWRATGDERMCSVCGALNGRSAPPDGVFHLGGVGFSGPPAHPNCRCRVSYVSRAQGRRRRSR